MIKIKFPALVLQKHGVDKINYKHFVGNPNYEKVGYKDVTIIDSSGNLFLVNGTRRVGRISIIDSIRNFDWLVKIEPILTEPVKKISLSDFKSILLEKVAANPKLLFRINSNEPIELIIQNSSCFEDLINVF
jgi:hypothetical protein